MALWAKVQQVPNGWQQMQQIYTGYHFPVEVRHYCAQWIEDQPWNELDEENQMHEQYAKQLLDSLVDILERRAAELNNDDMFIIKMKLQESVRLFRDTYGGNPLNLVRTVKNCLATEERLVMQAEKAAAEGHDMTETKDRHQQILQQFQFLHTCTQGSESNLRQLQTKQENFVIQYQDSFKIDTQLNALASQPQSPQRLTQEQALKQRKDAIARQLAQKAQELLQLRLALAEKHNQTFQQLSELQKVVLDIELLEWKRRQQLSGNGAPIEGNLDTLQQWCETLAELIWQNRQQIKKVELLRVQLPINIPADQEDLLPKLNNQITSLLSNLVTSTFVIEKQPPQVLKKDSRFSATVRLLVGGKLNVHMNPPQVKASIISEAQARALLNDGKNISKESSGEILNNTGTMEYNQRSGQLSVTFRMMQLKRIKRADRKGTETVLEEKFSLLFQSEFSIGGGELGFHVWTLSLPQVVIVHGNQECNAIATVLWDNQFAETGRIPFQVPDKVFWNSLGEMLNTKFSSVAGAPLSEENLAYLASKILGPHDDYTQQYVTWSQFNRETLPGRNFTFWEWFYSVLKLTKEHLKGPWTDRSIIGFINKVQAQEYLMAKQHGTFLLRFSDGELGGVSIAWVKSADSNNPGEKEVWNLAPFTAKDFAIRSLADRIKDLAQLINLYPDTPKAQAFGKYFTSKQPSLKNPQGYVSTDLVSVIPGFQQQQHVAQVMNFDNPNTPQPIQPQSPQYEMDNDFDEMIQGFSSTDYNPTDMINEINVNELLSNVDFNS